VDSCSCEQWCSFACTACWSVYCCDGCPCAYAVALCLSRQARRQLHVAGSAAHSRPCSARSLRGCVVSGGDASETSTTATNSPYPCASTISSITRTAAGSTAVRAGDSDSTDRDDSDEHVER
jgi:hypothetical protein